MSALPRGTCSVCSNNVALVKSGNVRTHYVRKETGARSGCTILVAADQMTGRVCEGTGKSPKEQS